MANASTPLGGGRLSWDYQFLIRIDEETYSIKEAPAAESGVVRRYVADILNTDIETPFDGTDVNFYIRLARFSVAGDEELEAPVARLLPRVVNAILHSNDAVKKVCSKLDHMVVLLVRGVNFLLDGADAVAKHTFGIFRQEMEEIKTKCSELNDLKRSSDEIGEILKFFHKVLYKRQDDVLEHAGIGLRGLHLYLHKNLNFWESLPLAIESSIKNDEEYMIMPMEHQGEERAQYVCSKAYKRHVTLFYAKWVALQNKCEQLYRRLKLIEKGLPASLTDTLNVHDARMRATNMAEELYERQSAERLAREIANS